MIVPVVFSLFFAGQASSEPVDIRAALVELTIDASGVMRACDTIESTGSAAIDTEACLSVVRAGLQIPQELIPTTGAPSLKWKHRAAMVQFSNGSSRLVSPPERMMQRVFMRSYPKGQHGVMLVEAFDKERGTRTCAFFAPRVVSTFDPAKCSRALSIEPHVADPATGKGPRTLTWTNAVVAAADL